MAWVLQDGILLYADFCHHVVFKKGIFYGSDTILSVLDMHNIHIKVESCGLLSLNIKIKSSELTWLKYDRPFTVIMDKAKFKKFKADCKAVKYYDAKIKEFLYNEIQLDEKGLCDIISDFVRI